MGITGLLPFLKNATREAHIREFSGKTAAIDVYGWLHRGTFGCADRIIKGEPTDGYIRYVMKFVNVFLSHDIRPILVFDGRNLPSKSLTEAKRRERRELNKKMGSEYLRDGRSREAMDCFRKAIDITWDMAYAVILEARRQGVDVLVAPYEADAQMAYLVQIGIADLVVSEDSDLVVFGCERIFFKIDMNGSGKLYDKSLLSKCFGGATNISFEKFRYISIMSGCDYLPSLHGIGLAKSLRFWKSINNPDITSVLPKIPSYLRMPQLEVTSEYIAGFIRANETFLYQIVYDPLAKKLQHLSPPPDLSVERHFAGQFLDEKIAYQMAIGNVNLRSLNIIDNYDPTKPLKVHSKYKSIWSNQPLRTVNKSEDNGAPKNGSQLLMNTAFAPDQSLKRKLDQKEAHLSSKREKFNSPEKEESNLKDLYCKNKDSSPIIKTSPSRKRIVVSKYFAIDTKDRSNDRKLERGRKNGGDWLDSIDSVVTHEDKFIYTTEEIKNEATSVSSSPVINHNGSSDKKRNPFAKPVVKSPSSPLRSPLLNIISPRGSKTGVTPEKKYETLLNINEKERVPKRLFNENLSLSEEVSPVISSSSESKSARSPLTNSNFLASPEDELDDKSIQFDTSVKLPPKHDDEFQQPAKPTAIKCKTSSTLKSLSNGSSSTTSPYFKKGNSKPSGLMRQIKTPAQQKSLLDFFGKK